MKIYQIIIGNLPEYLRACVESVKAFSNRVSADYIQITKVPDELNIVPQALTTYERNRTIKDWICLELLSKEPKTLIVDWDVYLYELFTFNMISKYPIFTNGPIDCMMFNGGDTASFTRMLELAGKPNEVNPGILLTANAFRLYRDEKPDFKYLNFKNDTYKHLDNCRLMQ